MGGRGRAPPSLRGMDPADHPSNGAVGLFVNMADLSTQSPGALSVAGPAMGLKREIAHAREQELGVTAKTRPAAAAQGAGRWSCLWSCQKLSTALVDAATFTRSASKSFAALQYADRYEYEVIRGGVVPDGGFHGGVNLTGAREILGGERGVRVRGPLAPSAAYNPMQLCREPPAAGQLRSEVVRDVELRAVALHGVGALDTVLPVEHGGHLQATLRGSLGVPHGGEHICGGRLPNLACVQALHVPFEHLTSVRHLDEDLRGAPRAHVATSPWGGHFPRMPAQGGGPRGGAVHESVLRRHERVAERQAEPCRGSRPLSDSHELLGTVCEYRSNTVTLLRRGVEEGGETVTRWIWP